MRFISPVRRNPVLLALFLAGAAGLSSLGADNAVRPAGLDETFIRRVTAVEQLIAQGDMKAATEANDALYEDTANRLAEARAQVADLSLLRINPLVSMEAREAGSGQFEGVRKTIPELVQHYGSVIQARPDTLERLGRNVSDSLRTEAKLYRALLATQAALNLALMSELQAKVKDGEISGSLFVQSIEEQLHGSGPEAARKINDVVLQSRPHLVSPSSLTHETVANTLAFLSTYVAATHDHDTAEDILTSVIRLDPGNVQVWTERAQRRMEAGDTRGTVADLMIAKALAPDSPEFLNANRRYSAIPQGVDHLYQEAGLEMDAANAKLQQMMGGALWPAGNRAANAARRNAGRGYYACSFLGSMEEVKKAALWVRENHRENVDVVTPEYLEAAKKLAAEFSAALAAGDKPAILAVFDHHAAMVASELVFWKTRTQALFQDGRIEAAAGALSVAAALKPDADWIPAFGREIADTMKKQKMFSGGTKASAASPSVARASSADSLEALSQAVARQPESAAPLIARARYFFRKSHVDSQLKASSLVVEWERFDDAAAAKLRPALDDLDRAVRLEPLSAIGWLERGRVRLAYMTMASDRLAGGFVYDDTLKDFERAIECEPANAEAWFQMGRTHLVLWTTSMKSIMFGVKQAEGEDIPRRATALRQAVAAFSRAIYFQPETSGEAHFQRALVLRELTNGGTDLNALLVDCSAAIAQNLSPTDADWSALCRSALDEEPLAALADMHLTRARVLRSRGELTAALRDLDEALEFFEKVHLGSGVKDYTLNARFERGRLRVQRGDYDGALADLEPVIQNHASPAEAWEWRALAHDGRGETDLARADFEEAFRRDARLRSRVAGSRYDAQNPNPARGLAPKPVTGDVRVVPPGTPLEHKNAGNALRGKKDLPGALREYNLALLIDPDFADGLNNRGSIYQDWGMYDLALLDLQRALEIDPKHRVAYLNRGLLWRELAVHDKERADLDRAVEFATTDASRAAAYRTRSWTRHLAKDEAGAEADAQSAVRLAPANNAAWLELGHLQINAGKIAEAATSYRRSIEINGQNWEAHAYLALVLALQDDAGAAAELHTALECSQAAQFTQIQELLKRALRNRPDSAALKALQALFEEEEAKRTTLKV